MYSSSLLVLALAVFGASAQSLVGCGCGFNGITGVTGMNGINTGISGINTGFSGINTGFSGINTGISGISTGISGVNTGIYGASTPVLENVPLRLPSIIHPTSVQESCNCIKTVVRPTLRKEVYTIPSVQRFVQTTSTPVVETVPYVSGNSVDLPAVSGIETGSSGLVSGGLVSGGLVSGGLVSGGLVSGGLVSGGLVSGGLVSGGLTSSGLVSGGLVSGVNTGCGCAY